MISIQKQFLFVHVPKTGGNSIQCVLRNHSEDRIVTAGEHQDGVERFGVVNRKYNTSKHSTLSDYKAALNADTYRSLFKFAAIRNPWDRMISFYFSPHAGQTDWNREAFLTLVKIAPPARNFICERSVLEKAAGRLGLRNTPGRRALDADIDFLLQFERLEDDFRILCEHLDVPHAPLPKRNCSSRKHYSHYYDDELKEIVRRKFAEEIAFGNYSFEKA